jgi:hypothetical protein
MALVAAPAYLARRGVPQTPYDLDAHNCIAFNFARYCDEWPFIFDGAHLSLPARGDVVASDGEISRRLATGRSRLPIGNRTAKGSSLCWQPVTCLIVREAEEIVCPKETIYGCIRGRSYWR